MSELRPPWPGLRALAARWDLWPALRELPPGEAPSAEAVQALGIPGPTVAAAFAQAALPGRWVVAGGPGWPRSLHGLPFGPVALQVEGDISRFELDGVAIVGARSCTAYGRQWSRTLARAVADAGGVVVSGLARGIDAEAHVAAGGATIAVLGQGLEVPLPSWQQELRARIVAAGGLVVSEFAPTTHAAAGTFLVRNRIIAGLACRVVVVEAAARSGSRNTAGHALQYGRDVLAVPGPLGAPASEGCLALLAEGAGLVTGPASVTEGIRPRPGSAASDEQRVRAALREPATLAEIAVRAGVSAEAAQALVGRLSLTGQVARLPGARFRLE